MNLEMSHQSQIISNLSHVYWARLMLTNIINGHGYTTYKHTTGPVIWSPSYYVSVTDCSGYINALIKQSYLLDPLQWSGVARPYASTYYKLILEQRSFTKITNIYSAKVGDFIVIRYLPGTTKTDNTGHIMLLNQLPIKINNRPPSIRNTIQWAVDIIDQSSSHGANDSRYATGKTGLGTGYLRIYTNVNGNLVGYSWSTGTGSKYVDHSVHPLVIGRLNL